MGRGQPVARTRHSRQLPQEKRYDATSGQTSSLMGFRASANFGRGCKCEISVGVVGCSIWLLKWILRAVVLANLCGCASGHAASNETALEGKSVLIREQVWFWFGGGILFLEIVFGYAAWMTFMKPSTTTMIALLLHIPFQFLPFLTLLREGWAECDTGLYWPVHWLYAAVLMGALALLGNRPENDKDVVPLIGLEGSVFAQTYMFLSTVANASDQYLDSMSATIAIRCGWSSAWLMVLVVIVSFGLQAFSAYWITGNMVAAIYALAGVNPEATALSSGADDHVDHMFSLSQHLSKFVTENLWQAILQIRFALEVKPSKMVWFSAGMSLLLSGKGFLNAASVYCKRQEAGGAVE